MAGELVFELSAGWTGVLDLLRKLLGALVDFMAPSELRREVQVSKTLLLPTVGGQEVEWRSREVLHTRLTSAGVTSSAPLWSSFAPAAAVVVVAVLKQSLRSKGQEAPHRH